ncbi:hypothetical protein PIB30_040133 [Stylosanthes scabra]|uniref:Uncharacterized protein n=1 Tax=Stylosanthes scabra TaxID=79078 RepID=A0ABU6TEU1_9FABA|nr:hypothetical protein [Stylosanthes scabra]
MSVRPGKYRRIFGLYEESFNDFKGRYFKVFPVGDHPPFWLTLEREAGRFPSYWSKDAGLNYFLVSYKKLNEEQRDTADILLWLFSKRFLKPKAVLGSPERAREAIRMYNLHFEFSVEMAGRKKALALLRQAMQANPQGLVVPNPMSGQASSSNPKGGGSSNAGEGAATQLEISSRFRRKGRSNKLTSFHRPPPGSMLTTRRLRLGRGRGFLKVLSGIFAPLTDLSMRRGTLRITSWVPVPWKLSVTTTRCKALVGSSGPCSRRADLEEEKAGVEAAKSQAEKDLEVSLKAGKEKDAEVQRLKDREVSLSTELESLRKQVSDEKARADKVEASFTATEAGRQQVLKLAEDAVKETENALKEQILVLAPDFNVSLLGAFKEIVDGWIVDPSPES